MDKSRGSVVAQEILGENFQGVLVSDCLATYDPIDCRKHKCISHHLQAISKAKELPGHADSHDLKQWTLLFKVVIVLHQLAADGQMDEPRAAAFLASRSSVAEERRSEMPSNASPE